MAAQLEADYVAVSFPKSSADLYMARTLINAAGCQARIIAKIERCEAITNLDDLINSADGIMVARGDLAVEVGDAAVPALQKRMIRAARERNKLTITATQMMESMISSPVPTRAEVSDVANAVLDGTDAVMLFRRNRRRPVPGRNRGSHVARVHGGGNSSDYQLERTFLNREFTRVDQSIAMAALFTANHLPVRALVSLTQTGSTALWISRVNCGVPIYALDARGRHLPSPGHVPRRVPMLLPAATDQKNCWPPQSASCWNAAGRAGDVLVVTIGDTVGMMGHTNTMKIIKAGESR